MRRTSPPAANFQLIRGDYALLGYTWRGCDEPIFRPPELDRDYGVPLDRDLCAETAPGTEWRLRVRLFRVSLDRYDGLRELDADDHAQEHDRVRPV